MCDTSHNTSGPSGPLTQSPFGSNSRHDATALASSSLNKNPDGFSVIDVSGKLSDIVPDELSDIVAFAPDVVVPDELSVICFARDP